ncbi:hypothetical protein Micbo1qcDRAFT_233913 [Microdochium bolleyi]|uniref:Uncharacterized protein n=1 Tax=Microdochium bolleyi TaxID=196109 RepID=A0A136J2L2_9PEZI|nr:hypothetical protein Micbo1qcDRAFT_233913 [Microdochium bolleyi]
MSSNNDDDRPQGSDKALLDRLNALKPTNVSLGSSTLPASTPASTIERAKPPSRDDALSDRLRSLRNQMGSPDPEPAPTAARAPQRTALSADAVSPAPLAPITVYYADGSGSGSKSHDHAPSNNHDDIDPLLSMPDDQTLEDLLADLESDQQWVEEVAAQEEDEQHRRAMALLKELSPGKKDGQGRGASKAGGNDGGGDDDDDDARKSDSDDSDGEAMTREADDLIAKAMDEAELDRRNTSQEEQEETQDSPARSTDAAKGIPNINKENEEAPFELPTVPSDPSPDNNKRTDQDDTFAASIASRMAALKVTSPSSSSSPSPSTSRAPAQLPSVPSTEPDPFAAMLPSAPTFSPQDPRDKPAVVTGVVRGRRAGAGYTDEDQASWCTVCLEDATVRCLGCRDDGTGVGDVYCARCWREMHVGEQAGYDERGHRCEKYERDRKG